MTDDTLNIYNAVYAYVEDSYKAQAADEGIEWTQEHNEFIGPYADNLYNHVMQQVEIYMAHFIEPLPDFNEDDK